MKGVYFKNRVGEKNRWFVPSTVETSFQAPEFLGFVFWEKHMNLMKFHWK